MLIPSSTISICALSFYDCSLQPLLANGYLRPRSVVASFSLSRFHDLLVIYLSVLALHLI